MKNRLLLGFVVAILLTMAGCVTPNPINKYPFIQPDVREAEKKPAFPMLSLYDPPPSNEKPDPGSPGYKIRPKNILIVGDSLSVGLGLTIAEALKGREDIDVRPEGKISSGLNSPSFFNWEEKLKELIAEKKPDVLVVLTGGNDAHNGPGSDAWADRFRDRVQDFLRIASAHDILVYWVELPPMKDKRFTRNVRVANHVMESVCSKVSTCRFVPTWDLCAGDKGGFAVSVQVGGEWVMLRVDDGAHFTHVGYRLLSRHVIEAMGEMVDLSPPPPTPEEIEYLEDIEGEPGENQAGTDEGEPPSPEDDSADAL